MARRFCQPAPQVYTARAVYTMAPSGWISGAGFWLMASLQRPGAYIDHFLRKVLSNSLQTSLLLGSGAVCTNTKLDANNVKICPTAVFEPGALRDSRESWHYSLGHWVEDDPGVGNGAFSSGGARGSCPWIRKARPGDDYGGWTTPIYGGIDADPSAGCIAPKPRGRVSNAPTADS